LSSKLRQPKETKSVKASKAHGADNKYILQLYVSGATPHSVKAIKNITELCDKYLGDNFELDIIDIYQRPLEARKAQIIAVPTLIKYQPAPVRRLCGDMSMTPKVLAGLGIEM
jgi:circadian clock protein KaiB